MHLYNIPDIISNISVLIINNKQYIYNIKFIIIIVNI